MQSQRRSRGTEVHIKRAGGAYLARRQRHQRLEVVGFAAGGLLASVAAGLAVNPYVGLLTGVAVGTMAGPALGGLRRLRANRLGDTSVSALLHRLSDDYFLVSDVLIPGHRGNVDHVLIGPCGVMVIEARRWAGRIRVQRDRLSVNGFPRASVTRQVTGGAMAVKEFLVRAHPELGGSLLRWVDTAIVFTHPRCRLQIDRPWHPVVRFSDLLALVEAKPRRSRYTAALGEMLAGALSDGTTVHARSSRTSRVLSTAS
jgi:Nuclease-related domain